MHILQQAPLAPRELKEEHGLLCMRVANCALLYAHMLSMNVRRYTAQAHGETARRWNPAVAVVQKERPRLGLGFGVWSLGFRV